MFIYLCLFVYLFTIYCLLFLAGSIAETESRASDRIVGSDEEENLINEEALLSVDFALLSALYGRRTVLSPTKRTEFVAVVCTFLLVIEMFGFAGMLHFLTHRIFKGNVFVLIVFAFAGITIIITTLVLSSLPQNSQRLFFKVPMLPWVPVLGLFLNIYILYGLGNLTWIRFAVWMTIGELFMVFSIIIF